MPIHGFFGARRVFQRRASGFSATCIQDLFVAEAKWFLQSKRKSDGAPVDEVRLGLTQK
jgi:hypothetical protein